MTLDWLDFSRSAAGFRSMRCVAVVAVLLAIGGCSIAELQREVEALYRVTVVIGRISTPADWRGPVIVAAVEEHPTRRAVAHQILLHEAGGFELIVPDGRYRIVAFGDLDGDQAPDGNEPSAISPSSIHVDGIPLIWLDLQLRFGKSDVVRAALPPDRPSPKTHSVQAGAPAELSSPALSVEAGKQGYWMPLDFVRDVGGNVFFLEPYDPTRAVVLFVHGATGSAQDFRHFYAELDRDRYQAWIFQYPSGAALDANADLLYWKLLQLQSRHTLARVHVVAHSMGGLLVRHFLTKYGAQFPQIEKFISISTPWAGEPAARLGVKHSIAVIPSWRDMEPEGQFIRELFDQPLPAHVAHTLLFGHRGGYNAFRPTTDGAVTLASQLRPEAQASANQVLGFDEDHVSVLSSRQVMERVMSLLDASNPQTNAELGDVYVALSQAAGTMLRGEGFAELALTRRGPDVPAATTTIVMPLHAGGAERLVARLEPGAYEARVLSPFFRSAPSVRTIRVTAGQASRSRFSLSQRGALLGDILLEGSPHVGNDTPSNPATPIRQVILEGPQGRRALVASNAVETLTAALVADRDALIGTQFMFIGLPHGEHTLTIMADGYEPHVSKHVVQLGVIPPNEPIVLQRARSASR